MMKEKITLNNNVHGTQATVITANGRITDSQYRRAEKKLCGMDDCRCRLISNRAISLVKISMGGFAVCRASDDY